MVPRKPWEQKAKYHSKTLSDSAVELTFIRNLDVYDLHAEYVWLTIPLFDLAQLGIAVQYGLTPSEFEPFMIDFTYDLPKTEETLQGIWAKFTPVDFTKLYEWLTELPKTMEAITKPEAYPPMKPHLKNKAIYGQTYYGRGIYDPELAREAIRATLWKLRQMRTADISWVRDVRDIARLLEMAGITEAVVWNRLMLLMSAQINCFVLGLTPIGKGRLAKTEDGCAVIPIIRSDGKEIEVKFRTLDHLMFGFILGVTPLGFGMLLPKEGIFKTPTKENPSPLSQMIGGKTRGITYRVTASTWAWAQYNKPEEMTDRHKSDRTTQYDLLQEQRRWVEKWVEARVPPEESNPVKLRQYKNAVLQLIAWPAKRHRWGFALWKMMTEEQFKEWWLTFWERQGLNKGTLEALYEGAKSWVGRLREDKLRLGEKVKRSRLRLALSV